MQHYGGTTLHQRLLLGVITKLQAEGWKNIKVDHIPWEWGRPAERSAVIPDIEAERFGHYRLVEVEAEDTYQEDRDHVALLAEYADMHANFEFFVACPVEFQEKLREAYENEWDIRPDGYYSL
jgi:hypothetical protein